MRANYSDMEIEQPVLCAGLAQGTNILVPFKQNRHLDVNFRGL